MLIDDIGAKTKELDQQFENEAKSFIKAYVQNNIDYSHTVDEVNTLDQLFRNEHTEDSSYYEDKSNYEKSRSDLWSHFLSNGQYLFKKSGHRIESFKHLVADLQQDYRDIQINRKTIDISNKEIDEKTSDRLINIVQREYKKNISEAEQKISVALHNFWQEKSQELRNQLIHIIDDTDALLDGQRKEIASIIIQYEQLEFDDDADKIFIKKRFLRKNVFGDSERINNRKLTHSYNEKMRKNTKTMGLYMNGKCRESFQTWQQSLCAKIEENITEYNPKLRTMAALIKDDKEKIRELEGNKNTISAAIDTINELMAWKEDDYSE